MYTDNLLDLLPPEIISFILKYLPEQELKNSRSINNIWKRECNLSKDYPEWLLKNLFFRGLSPKDILKVHLNGLQALAVLKKQLEEYYFQHNTLERRVKRLERDVKDLDKCVDRETVVDLIQKIVPLLVREKSLIKNNPSSSSSDYSSNSDIDDIVKMIKHQR
ncbi:hypothetical protein C1646_772744 [Rhizophagus diaphanus]|nr:hypothetical protein C1646_772744 [Rhizophagus diaphanus] [Rhizophagus sp. MUCL 43196]